MNGLKYALIGCGRISKNHIEAARNSGLDIVALCDIDNAAMETKATQMNLGNVKKYSNYREMLEKENLDLVAIAAESGKHAPIAIDCIKKSTHVIIEKPIALSISDAQEIIDESASRNIKVSVCHQNRFNKSVQKLRDAVEASSLGKILHGCANIRWNRGKEYYEQSPWRGTWAQDGGTLMNQCIHNIDLLCWMMGGEISEVFAYTDRLAHPYIEAEDLGIAVIKFKNGGYGIIEGSSNIYPENFEETLCLFGTGGTVKLGGKSVNTIEHWAVKDSVENARSLQEKFTENPPDVYGFGHIPLYRDMITAIQDDRKPYIDAEAGKKAMELVLAIYKSAMKQTVVKFPVTDITTLNFKDRFKTEYGISL